MEATAPARMYRRTSGNEECGLVVSMGTQDAQISTRIHKGELCAKRLYLDPSRFLGRRWFSGTGPSPS